MLVNEVDGRFYCALNRHQMCSVQNWKTVMCPHTVSTLSFFLLLNYCCGLYSLLWFHVSHFQRFLIHCSINLFDYVALRYILLVVFPSKFTQHRFFSVCVHLWLRDCLCFFHRSLVLFLNDLIDIIYDERNNTWIEYTTHTRVWLKHVEKKQKGLSLSVCCV